MSKTSDTLGLTPLPKDDEMDSQGNLKISFFTPLPPMRSGISEYSFELLCELANSYEIDVFIDDGYVPDCNLPANIRIFSHSMFEKQFASYDRYLYQVGNSEFHLYMFPYITKYGGIVVLHDFNLQMILRKASIVPESGDFKEYARLLSYDYDSDTVDKIISETYKRNRDIIVEYPANGFITTYASKVIVHSEYAKHEFQKLHKEIKVEKIPHYSKVSSESQAEAKVRARKILGIPQGKMVISSFGNMDEKKRTMPAIKALNRLLTNNRNLICFFVGECYVDGLNDYIQKNSLQEFIILTEYVEFDTFLLYMDASDLCINLRYPYHGENSGALSRLLPKGRCVLVTDIGSFSEVPDGCCVKLPSPENMTQEQEVDMIYHALLELLNDPVKLKRIGDNAYEYAKEALDIKTISKQYVEAINNSPHAIGE